MSLAWSNEQFAPKILKCSFRPGRQWRNYHSKTDWLFTGRILIDQTPKVEITLCKNDKYIKKPRSLLGSSAPPEAGKSAPIRYRHPASGNVDNALPKATSKSSLSDTHEYFDQCVHGIIKFGRSASSWRPGKICFKHKWTHWQILWKKNPQLKARIWWRRSSSMCI